MPKWRTIAVTQAPFEGGHTIAPSVIEATNMFLYSLKQAPHEIGPGLRLVSIDPQSWFAPSREEHVPNLNVRLGRTKSDHQCSPGRRGVVKCIRNTCRRLTSISS